jgi:hypothetical protein
LSRDIPYGTPADATRFTFDKEESKSVAFTLIVTDQISHVVACIRELASLNLGVDPSPHFVRH